MSQPETARWQSAATAPVDLQDVLRYYRNPNPRNPAADQKNLAHALKMVEERRPKNGEVWVQVCGVGTPAK